MSLKTVATMRTNTGGRRTIYRDYEDHLCAQCNANIRIGDLFTRTCKKDGNRFVCRKCRPVVIESKEDTRNPLTYFIENDVWFKNANGDATELLERIAQACGYSELKKNRSFANMVGWHIDKYHSNLLAARFFCLVNEVAHEFPEIRSEAGKTFERMFGE